MFKVDTSNFKVICQRCGKTGQIDFDGPQNTFVLLFGQTECHEHPVEYEYTLCFGCYEEVVLE
jgi:hypothetical protein